MEVRDLQHNSHEALHVVSRDVQHQKVLLEPGQCRLPQEQLPENNDYPTQERDPEGNDLKESDVVNHLSEVVLVVLELFESKHPVEKGRRSRLSLPHHAAKALVTDVEHHANYLVRHVQCASPVHDVFVPEFKSRRVLVELQLAQVAAPTVVLPLDLSAEQLHKLGVAQSGASLVLRVLTRPLDLSVGLRLERCAFEVTDRIAILARLYIQNKTVGRDEVPGLDLDYVADAYVVPRSLQEPLVPPVEHKLLAHEFVDSFAGLFYFLIVKDIYRGLGDDADCRDAVNNVPALFTVLREGGQQYMTKQDSNIERKERVHNKKPQALD